MTTEMLQEKVEIGNRSQEELTKHTKQIGMEYIIKSVEKIKNGDYTLIPNPEEDMTYFTFRTSEDVKAFYKAGKKFF